MTELDAIRAILQADSETKVRTDEPLFGVVAYVEHMGHSVFSHDPEFDVPEGLTSFDILSIRVTHHSGEPVDAIAFDYKLDASLVEDIVTGKRAPLSGGPLVRQDYNGLYAQAHKTRNRRRFAQNVIALAKILLDPFVQDVYLGLSGLTQESAQRMLKYQFSGVFHDTATAIVLQQYRSFLRGNAKKKGVTDIALLPNI